MVAVELFTVAADEDAAFLAAWQAEAPAGAALYRALRSDTPFRYASLAPPAPPGGVVLLAPAGDASAFEGRQGFLGARTDGDVTVVHWSSPLMYQRAVQALGERAAGRRALPGYWPWTIRVELLLGVVELLLGVAGQAGLRLGGVDRRSVASACFWSASVLALISASACSWVFVPALTGRHLGGGYCRLAPSDCSAHPGLELLARVVAATTGA